MATKTLLVFCDGTGMDGTLAPPSSGKSAEGELNPQVPIDEQLSSSSDTAGGYVQYASNVMRLSRSVKELDANGKKQIVFYQSGVGSESNFAGDPVTGTTAMQALGTAVASKIRDAYAFIAQNFVEGDEICLFGFSRGAYTVRKLSGLIDRIGLLTTGNLRRFAEIWLQLIDKKTLDIPPDTRYPNIKCVGVWDTVGSVYKEIDALNIADTSLPKTVKVALHAISLQENRQKFLPTLWSLPQGGLQPDQVFKQVWFPGAHADVGGGYERHELSDITLYWMAGEIKSFITLDLEALRSYAQVNPEPWGTSQPHNAYEETPLLERPIIGHKTRLESGQITPQSVFHECIKYSPQKLTSPDYMITMTIIAQSFGSGFAPLYPPLNEFEQYCKDNWGRGPTRITAPEIIIRPTARWMSNRVARLGSSDTVVGGVYRGGSVYVARAPYRGGLYPGALFSSVEELGMVITYDGKRVKIPNPGYELLTGRKTRWVPVSGNFALNKLYGDVPVRGGRDTDGGTLFVAQVVYGGTSWCGRVKDGEPARFPHGPDDGNLPGTEETVQKYNVLVFV